MQKDFSEFLALDVTELLDHPAFREWALAPEVEIPPAHPELGEARDLLLSIAEVSPVVPGPAERAADFAALMNRLEPEATRPAATRRLWPRWAAAAAAVVLLCWAGSSLLRTSSVEEYATGNGEQRKVELPDGTAVLLNANSSLRLPAGGWSADERTVRLDGEAFFQVTKQLAQGEPRPFLVKTEAAVVRVLGTRFNVRQRRGSLHVFLEEGAVKVGWPGTAHQATELLPGETVDFAAAHLPPVHRPAFTPENETAWTRGRLVFERVSLRKALDDLSDLYGIAFVLAGPELETKEVSSAGIPVDNQEVALRLLATALNLKIEEREDNVYSVSLGQ